MFNPVGTQNLLTNLLNANRKMKCFEGGKTINRSKLVSSVKGVGVEISVVLGRASMPMKQLLRMGRGAVIELDSRQDEEVWILANNRPVARGEISIQGDKLAVSITDTIKAYDAL
jgi:flagellar motor switch protein FliN/FliY